MFESVDERQPGDRCREPLGDDAKQKALSLYSFVVSFKTISLIFGFIYFSRFSNVKA